jgi:hypothetical protein
LIVVAWDYSATQRGGYPGYDDAAKNMPLPAGRNRLAAEEILRTAQGLGGFSSDLLILQANSRAHDGPTSFYETLKRGEVYRGYYSGPFQEIINIFKAIKERKKPRARLLSTVASPIWEANLHHAFLRLHNRSGNAAARLGAWRATHWSPDSGKPVAEHWPTRKCPARSGRSHARWQRIGLRFDPTPHLIALAMAANIGSAGTITGNPQNIYIGSHSGISYLRFTERLLPVAAMGLVLNFLVVAFVYHHRSECGDFDQNTVFVGQWVCGKDDVVALNADFTARKNRPDPLGQWECVILRPDLVDPAARDPD